MLKVVYVQFVALVCLPTVDERDLEEEIMVGSAVFDLAGPTCKCFCPLVCVVHCIHPFLFFFLLSIVGLELTAHCCTILYNLL